MNNKISAVFSILLLILFCSISAQSKKDLYIRKGHLSPITFIKYTPDGRKCVSISNGVKENAMLLWDIESGKELIRYTGNNGNISFVDIHKDGKLILSNGGYDSLKSENQLLLWDLIKGKIVYRIAGNGGLFSPDGKYIVYSNRGQFKLFDLEKKKDERDLFNSGAGISQCSFSHDGKYFMDGYSIYETATWQKIMEEEKDIYNKKFTPEGTHIIGTAVNEYYKSNYCINIATGEKKNVFRFSSMSDIITPDQKYIFNCGEMALYDLNTGNLVRKYHGHIGNVLAVDFAPDYKSFISAGADDKTIKIWDFDFENEKKEFEIIRQDPAESIFYSPDGKYIMAADVKIEIFDSSTLRLVKKIETKNRFTAVYVSKDWKNVITGDDKNVITLWDVENSKAIKKFKGHKKYIDAVCLSIDGSKIYSAEEGNMVFEWDIKSGKMLKNFMANESEYTKLAGMICSADGKSLIITDEKEYFNIIDLETGKIERRFSWKRRDYQKSIVKLSNDQSYYIMVSNSGRIWKKDFNTNEVLNYIGTFDVNRTIAFDISPRENRIALTNGYGSYIIDIHNKKIENILTFKEDPDFRYPGQVCFSPDGKEVTASFRNLVVWNTDKGLPKKDLKGKSVIPNSAVFSPDGKNFLIDCEDNTVRLWDIGSLKETGKIKLDNTWTLYDYDTKSVFGGDGKSIYSTAYNDTLGKTVIYKTDIGSGKTDLHYDLVLTQGHYFSDNSKYLIVNQTKAFEIIDVKNKKEYDFSGFDTPERFIAGISKDSTYVVKKEDGKFLLFDFSETVYLPKDTLEIKADTKIEFTPGNRSVVYVTKDTICVAEMHTWKVLRRFPEKLKDITGIKLSHQGKLLITNNYQKSVSIWDFETGKKLYKIEEPGIEINSCVFSPDEKHILATFSDGSTKLYESKKGKILAMMLQGENEWIVCNADGYFDGSVNCSDLAAFTENGNIYEVDQFAPIFNRPDLLIKNINGNSIKTSEYYYNQYKKRLKKLGLKEENLKTTDHVPAVLMERSEKTEKFLDIVFTASDSIYSLRSYNIFVNDVPLYGVSGKAITGNSVSLSENIELTTGTNKIELSCINEKSTESLRQVLFADYFPKAEGDLYYLAFGVSQYMDPSLNLKYADKDANDLSETFSKLDKTQFNNVYTKTFTNGQATLENIKSAKGFLKNSKPDDTFILFIAGHGVHDTDKEATYYYLTHETNLNDLPNTAANFELIEDILQGIPPRNKLFLMDTCESGEIEEGVQNTYYASADSRGLKGRGIKVTEKVSAKPVKSEKRTYLFEKDRYIYNDLARRSGAIVFSSSKGGELSYEKDEIQNGLFTEEIIKCLTSKEADKDKNGIISTDELREYVFKAVAASSGDLQHPTVDRDNIYQKFGFGIVK
jgi:WD40 repeat protein